MCDWHGPEPTHGVHTERGAAGVSQVDGRPDTLAAISQANLRGVRDGIPGTLVLQVDPLQQHGVEQRRIW